MKAININVKPFEMISVLTYNGTFQLNEHGYVQISGLIPSNKREEYIQKAMRETWVQVDASDEEGNKKPLFYGILKALNIHPGIDGSIMSLTLYTGTWLMDCDKHKRSFQKPEYTYREAANCCNESYTRMGMIMTEGKNDTIPGFLMQYEETDWEFLKRLASCLHTVLVPACYVPGEKFFFGLPEKQMAGKLDTENYTICQSDETGSDGKTSAGLSYIVKSRNIFFLGDRVCFNGQELYIWKIEIMMEGSELWHTCYLKKKSSIYIPRLYNREITGLSLMGRIQAVKGEEVKITIDSDENPQSGTCWFPFSTVYSSADGAGWYCMPETGDAVRLYFPTEDEADAYVASAFHENQGNGIRTNPDHKIWRNKAGKEIRLTPDSILVTNNEGMLVELSDQDGIKISSRTSISIEATENIRISSINSNLEMSASNKIELLQGSTKLEMADGIRMSGATIKMQ